MKIGVSGKLFEPMSLARNKDVAEAGVEIFGSGHWAYIGVDDIGNNETFKYSTGEHIIAIQNPPWWSTDYPKGTGTYCVSMYVNNAKWFDGSCSSGRFSVCEATFQPQPDDSQSTLPDT